MEQEMVAILGACYQGADLMKLTNGVSVRRKWLSTGDHTIFFLVGFRFCGPDSWSVITTISSGR